MLFKFKGHLLKPKLKIICLNFYFEFFNTHTSHLAQLSMINMALKWHHKNISNKVTNLKEFWRLSNMVFSSFDCIQIVIVNHFFLFLSYPCVGVTMT
jgi:hypothetical protein